MELVRWFGKMGECTRVCGKMDSLMVLENYKQKIQFMKAILNKGDHINMEFVVGWMAVSTKVSITWEKNKEQENIDSTTEEFMRDNG